MDKKVITQSSLDIKLKRIDRIYRSGDVIEGSVVVTANKGWSHNGLKLTAEGVIHLSTTSRGIMGLGTEYVGKQIQILKVEQDLSSSGKFSEGDTEVPFSFQLKPLASQNILESYHGVYISIIYYISVICERGMMKKTLTRDLEFIVELPLSIQVDSIPIPFAITPDTLDNAVKTSINTKLTNFRITGKLHRSNYPINMPFTGELIVELNETPIKSIQLQLVRIESVFNESESKMTRECTEVQNIHIGK